MNSFTLSASLRLCGVFLLLSAGALSQARDYTRWVDPFIGTGGHGHTFPGATMPFGMVQLSPDTRTDNWDGSSGYHYSDDIIYGFSHTHLSGTGIPDYCDVLLMPTAGDHGQFNSVVNGRGPEWYTSPFSHSNERAEPGYYSVKLDKWDVLAELTATTRVGFHRYTFQNKGTANIVLDLLWRDKVLGSEIKDVTPVRLEGFRRSASWAKDQTTYFVAEFSKPYQRSIGQGRSMPDVDTTNSQRIYKFSVRAGEQILVKVAISSVSIEGARKNLEAELPGWDFEKARADAKAAWNKELSKIEVSGGTDAQTTTFYTALYHTMIQPNIFNDVDGNYRGHDGNVHNISEDIYRGDAETQRGISETNGRREAATKDFKNFPPPRLGGDNYAQYTVFSLWDTFRAAHPLYTIIDQKRTADFINTFIRQYERGGRLPVWELAGEETDTMIGYHAVSVIADAMAKGIKGFDYEKAYEAAKHSAELDHFGLAAYKKRGYISMEDENESVSKTLEYAYDDWCIAQMANHFMSDFMVDGTPGDYLGAMGIWPNSDSPKSHLYEDIFSKKEDYQRYMDRARSFENLFDTNTGFMRPRVNGGFVRPFAPNEVTFNFTEGNSWVYSFFVPQDVSRLMELYRGPKKFAAKLDELFTTKDKLAGREQPDITGLIGQYAHGNEPSHHIAYLYDYAGEPWKTQKIVRQIMDEFYKPAPDGLIGNEDCGQMSAWYILSASGFYPVTPGSPVYAFGTPLFPEMAYRLENGKTFKIRAKNVSKSNFYIQSASLNDVPYTKAFINQDDIMNGGVLEFTMTHAPATTAFTEFPVSSMQSESVAVPRIEGRRIFDNSQTVFMHTATGHSKIYYTLDGSDPNEKSTSYVVPIKIDQNAHFKAVAIGRNAQRSMIAEAAFTKKPNDWTVKIESKYNRQYTGGG
ncbi:MAG TPA: GH92 family glycosyl hydrolase, partial [Pyrinomonadaceae bacterium]|nr:GH92 family glycosyl hydrolase [Pyrinomonadaceae bacterium]